VILRRGGGGEEARLNSPRRKSGKGGARGSAHREGFHDSGGGRTAAVARSAGARRSDGDLVGFRHGRWRSWDGVCETRRGGVGSAVAFSDTASRKWPVETAFNPPGAFGHRRPRQPIRARREATLPLTAGPHSSAFSVLKITHG
jgi:hypothetical protein